MRTALFFLLALALILILATAALAQQPAQTETPQPTAEPTINFGVSTPTPIPHGIPPAPKIGSLLPRFLSGVGATPLNGNVSIRLGPGLTYPRVGVLRVGKSIDVVGTNGYDQSRSCLVDFRATLDMWIQVQFDERRGWISRCAVDVTGDMSQLLVQPPP